MAVYTGMHGKKYTLDRLLGNGGEGEVYAIAGNSSQVIKLYKAGKFHSLGDRKAMERKLKVMISMQVPIRQNQHICLAWPQDIVYDNGWMVGFVMPKVATSCKIYDIYRGGKNAVREKLYPHYTWKYAVQFAYNLSCIVHYLHNSNIVIGDFNQNNVAVDGSTNTLILIDCDSFDIRDPKTGEHFPCTVGLPEMLAPELQLVGNLSYGTFTRESDNFSLAIHIFRLLMDNADPFGGVITTTGASSLGESPANRAIVNGECAYVRSVPNKAIPKWSHPLSILPSEIVAQFDKTFNYTAVNARQRISRRATADDWIRALAPYAAAEPNKLLRRCKQNAKHVFAAHNTVCPWCGGAVAAPKGSFFKKLLVIGALAAGLYFGDQHFQLGLHDAAKAWGHEIAAQTVQWWEDNAEPMRQWWDNAVDTMNELTGITTDSPTASAVSEYILPDSNTRMLQQSDLEGLTAEELALARNEIYARHGRIFKTEWIRAHFRSTSWYEERYQPEEFDSKIDSFFNDYEKYNVDFIAYYEEHR